MHGVIVQVEIDESHEEEARTILREVTVPRAKQLAGFSAGNWLRALDDARGMSVLLFDTEDAARAAAKEIKTQGPPPGAPVTMKAVDVFEVLASA